MESSGPLYEELRGLLYDQGYFTGYFTTNFATSRNNIIYY